MKTFVAEPLLIIPRQCLWPTASCLIATEKESLSFLLKREHT